MWWPDGQVGLVGFSLGLSRLAVSIDTWGARRCCGAKDHAPTKTRPAKVQNMESFPILRFYEFMIL